ncbi:MAG: PEGA domain-containing protein, partial [Thermoanaerobaculia bacterium]|nr:PEGA domain-containing protein [Thermoanaerobaculia bacterium]
MFSRSAAIFWILVSLMGALPAQAELQWYQHYEQGLRAADQGAWNEALDHFEAAAAVEPTPLQRVRTYGRDFLFDYDPAYQRARCLAALERPTEALEQIEISRQAGITPRTHLDRLEAELQAIATDLPGPAETGNADGPARLRVDSDPPGSRVWLDGQILGTTPLSELEVPVGSHRLEIRNPCCTPWIQQVVTSSDEMLHLDVHLDAKSPSTLRLENASTTP